MVVASGVVERGREVGSAVALARESGIIGYVLVAGEHPLAVGAAVGLEALVHASAYVGRRAVVIVGMCG